MVDVCDIYSKGIKRTLKNYWAAWLPSTRFQLGDIGILNGYYFEKIGSLRELNIQFEIDEDSDSSPLEIVSESNVSFTMKLAGELNKAFSHVPQANAGLKIDFGAQGAFIVQAPDTYESAIGNLFSLQSQIIAAFRDGRWEKDWLVLVRIVTSPSATILISSSSSAGLELSTEANLSAEPVELGKAELGLAVKFQRGDIIKMIGAQNVSPFFQLGKLKQPLFTKSKFVTKSMRGQDRTNVYVPPSLGRDASAVSDYLSFDLLEDSEFDRP